VIIEPKVTVHEDIVQNYLDNVVDFSLDYNLLKSNLYHFRKFSN
jgi:hypothetical protein